MRFFLDSANLDDINWAAHSGFVTGVTVNQSLIAKEEKQDLLLMFQRIANSIPSTHALSLPLTKMDPRVAIEEAKHYAKLHMPTYVKVPVSRETLPLIAGLSRAGLRVNATCIFTGLQAACAAAAGAEILSIFVGRINDDMPGYGWKVIEAATKVACGAQVLAGSIRDKMMVAASLDHGADIVTTSRKVLEQLAEERGTALSVAKFNADLEAWMA